LRIEQRGKFEELQIELDQFIYRRNIWLMFRANAQSIFPPQKQQPISPKRKNSPLQAGELET